MGFAGEEIMGITSNFANVATVTRASTKTDAGGWDFTNGGTVGTLTEYASGVAAIHSTAGLLVEESTTNEVRNPRCEGAVAGTPGTLPTNWIFVVGGGVTTSVVGSGTEDGWPYVDVRISGTAAGSATSLYFESSTQMVAAQGDDITDSIGLKITAGSLSNFTGVRLAGVERTGAGASAGSLTGTTFSPGSTHKRYFENFTMAQATTAYWQPRLDFLQGTGAVDLTLRVYAPQSEDKAYPTSPVFPVVSSPAATTRASDDVTVPNGAWSNDNAAGTLYVEAVLNCTGVSGNFGTIGASYGADVANDYIRFRAAGLGSFNVVAEDGNTVVVSTIGTQTISGPAHAVYGAIAWDTNDVVASLRGETQTYDTSATVGFGAAKLIASSGSGSTTFPSQYIKDLRYWPKRLTNAELEALVGN